MTLYRATVVDVPADPFTTSDALRVEADGALLVTDGVIVDRGPFADLRARHPDEPVDDRRDGLLLPGFVDTHVHYPQLRAIGGLGMPLLDWLQQCALPEEVRFADDAYAATVADEQALFAVMAPWSTGDCLPNFAPSVDPAQVVRKYDAETLARLASLSVAYDPHGVLSAAGPVRAAADLH